MTNPTDAPPRVLTLVQPWAWAVFNCGKDVENRRWRATFAPGTRVLIHAAASRADASAARALGVDVRELPRGELAGMVTVRGFTRDSCSPWAVPGGWHWLLADAVRAVSSVRCDGRRMLWPAPAGWRAAFCPSGLGADLEHAMSAIGAPDDDPLEVAVRAGRLMGSMFEGVS